MPARYAYYELVQEWPELAVAVNQLESRLRAAGHVAASDILVRSFAEFRRELVALGRKSAAFASEELRRTERKTRVRPDTQGQGGPRLESFLVAEPLNEGLIPGSIGVANEDVLDAHVPWWITNEIGSSARVGGRLFGLFYGGEGDAPPDPTAFREHPLFAPTPARGGGGPGVIENPIPARRFIEKSIPAINAEWKMLFEASKARMGAAIDRALSEARQPLGRRP